MTSQMVGAKAALAVKGTGASQRAGRLRDQFHEVARFKHLSVRTERAYWEWVVRFLKFYRSQNPEFRRQNDNEILDGASK
jgi:hypothetical protein